MPVYFIRQASTDRVKVGYAGDPVRRRANLQIAQADRLTIIRLLDGDRSDERRIHDLFREYRIQGDWFSLADALVAGNFGLADLPIPATGRRRDAFCGAVRTPTDLIDRLGGYLKVAQSLDVPRGNVASWRSRQVIPTRYWRGICRMAEAEGVQGVSFDHLLDLHVPPVGEAGSVVANPRAA